MKAVISNQDIGANAAANVFAANATTANFALGISEEFSQQGPAPYELYPLPELSFDWTPFRSSLIDTVRVVMYVAHKPLASIVEGNTHMSRDGFTAYVHSPLTDAVATVFSFDKQTKLVFEFSIPKFLTGQNVVGIENMHSGCLTCIQSIFKLMGFRPTAAERKAIKGGGYRLTRVDWAKHIDCGTADRAAAMMIALRNHLVGKAKDVTLIDKDSLYVGKHSTRRALKLYLKYVELLKQPMHPNVYGRNALLRRTLGLVRVEATVRRKELAKLKLDNPMNWTAEVGHRLLDAWMTRLQIADGKVPDVSGVGHMTPVLQQKFRAWVLGDAIAFSRGVSHDCYRDNRRRVLTATGIDIDSHLTPEQQRVCTLTIREMFAAGWGYQSREDKWNRLLSAVNGDAKH